MSETTYKTQNDALDAALADITETIEYYRVAGGELITSLACADELSEAIGAIRGHLAKVQPSPVAIPIQIDLAPLIRDAIERIQAEWRMSSQWIEKSPEAGPVRDLLAACAAAGAAKVQPAATGRVAEWEQIRRAFYDMTNGIAAVRKDRYNQDEWRALVRNVETLRLALYAYRDRHSAEREGEAMAVKGTGIVHELKVWREYFAALMDGRKTFEWRKEDRGFAVGDVLRLREFIPDKDCGVYTGREVLRTVTYWTTGPACGIPEGYCILALAPAPQPPAPVEVSEEMVDAALFGHRACRETAQTVTSKMAMRAALTAALECQRGGA